MRTIRIVVKECDITFDDEGVEKVKVYKSNTCDISFTHFRGYNFYPGAMKDLITEISFHLKKIFKTWEAHDARL